MEACFGKRTASEACSLKQKEMAPACSWPRFLGWNCCAGVTAGGSALLRPARPDWTGMGGVWAAPGGPPG